MNSRRPPLKYTRDVMSGSKVAIYESELTVSLLSWMSNITITSIAVWNACFSYLVNSYVLISLTFGCIIRKMKGSTSYLKSARFIPFYMDEFWLSLYLSSLSLLFSVAFPLWMTLLYAFLFLPLRSSILLNVASNFLVSKNKFRISLGYSFRAPTAREPAQNFLKAYAGRYYEVYIS